MSTILKYDLPLPKDSFDEVLELEMPPGARILHLAEQHGKPRVWALITSDLQLDAEPVVTRLRVIPTGLSWPTSDPLDYIGTIQLQHGHLVFHVFKEVPS